MTYKDAWHLLTLWLEERADKYAQRSRLSANAGLLELAKLDAPKAEILRDVIATMGRIEDKIKEEAERHNEDKNLGDLLRAVKTSKPGYRVINTIAAAFGKDKEEQHNGL